MTLNPSDENAETGNSPRRVTLRDIAKELGVSHVTVSKALRNSNKISDATKIRVLEKAEAMGYFPDPLLAHLSRYRRASKTKPIQAAIAWINPWPEPDALREHNEFNLYWKGAAESARRHGYQLEAFNTARIPLPRLQTILKTRNIQGILLPPLGDSTDDWNAFAWDQFAVVRLGQAIPYPATHFVGSAQMENSILAFDRAHQLGYKRIGFVCEYWRMRFFGVGYSWAQKNRPSKEQLPLLTLNPADDFKQQQCTFETWLQQTKPDAILTDNSETQQMLKNLGYRIPEDIGLATTSIHDTTIDAGIDQQPYEIGRAAIRMLTALMAEKSFGIPECRNKILIDGVWVDGSMLPDRREQ